MRDDIFVVKSRVTGRLFHTGTQEFCQSIAVMMNHAYQTDEYYVEPWDEKLAAGFLGASGAS